MYKVYFSEFWIFQAHGKSARESLLINGYALNCTIAAQQMPRLVRLDVKIYPVCSFIVLFVRLQKTYFFIILVLFFLNYLFLIFISHYPPTYASLVSLLWLFFILNNKLYYIIIRVATMYGLYGMYCPYIVLILKNPYIKFL